MQYDRKLQHALRRQSDVHYALNKAGSIAICAAVALSMGCKSIVKAALEPDHGFDAESSPEPPDYASLASWAALPDRRDGADIVPPGDQDGQAKAMVDVFFIHPTTYFSGKSWNQPLDHQRANEGVDTKVLPNQASAFNSVARVYAPRYRQATFGTFTSDSLAERNRALDLAYSDVERAFEHYLESFNAGRPFFVASHSQGSQHAVRLLHRLSNDDVARQRFVAAYVVGTPIEESAAQKTFPSIPVCERPDQTGCMINYNTITPEAKRTRFFEAFTWFPESGYTKNSGRPIICVNPISWRRDEEIAPKSQHVGAWRNTEDTRAVDVNFVSARCVDGLLETTASRDDYAFSLGRSGDLHLVDYSLFYMDIRKNAEVRAHAWRAANDL